MGAPRYLHDVTGSSFAPVGATHASPYGVGPRTRVGVAARIGRCVTRRIGFAGSTSGRRMRRPTASAAGPASALRHGLAGVSHGGSDSRGRPAGRRMRRRTASAAGPASALRHGLAGASHGGSDSRGRPAGDACVAVRRRPPDARRRYGTDWPVRHTADRIRGVDQRATHASPLPVQGPAICRSPRSRGRDPAVGCSSPARLLH